MAMFPSNLTSFLRNKDSLLAQFAKYALCGGTAVAVDQALFYLLAWLVFPCLRLTDPVARILTSLGFSVQEVPEAELKTHYWIIKAICFVASNAVVYILNALFVFHGGRHSRAVEVLLFFAFSLLQFLFIGLGGVLISRFGWEVTTANFSMLALGVVVNYLVRKKLIFKR